MARKLVDWLWFPVYSGHHRLLWLALSTFLEFISVGAGIHLLKKKISNPSGNQAPITTCRLFYLRADGGIFISYTRHRGNMQLAFADWWCYFDSFYVAFELTIFRMPSNTDSEGPPLPDSESPRNRPVSTRGMDDALPQTPKYKESKYSVNLRSKLLRPF